MNKNITKAFHPGFYLKEYLEELQMTQDEFAKRLGISGKQLSLILNETASITADIAYKLSRLMNTSVEMWLNLQTKYDAYCIEIKNQKELLEEKKIFKMIDSKFLIDLNIINKNDKIDEAISKLRKASPISSLNLYKQPDIYCSYRSVKEKDEQNLQHIVCKNVWVSLATTIAKNEKVSDFNEEKLLSIIPTLRNMTTKDPEMFYPKMKKLLNDCGVAFVLLPNLKNSYINGVVKWIDDKKVMMALNTRGAYNDIFWFSFFHELKHVLQKAKRKIILSDVIDTVLEYEADLFAANTLIPQNQWEQLKEFDLHSIVNFSKEINIHPGIVVGRLQKEKKIKYSHFNHLKEKYNIIVENVF